MTKTTTIINSISLHNNEINDIEKVTSNDLKGNRGVKGKLGRGMYKDTVIDKLIELNKLGIAKVTEVEKTGCEGLADFLYEYVNTILLPSFGKVEAEKLWCCAVEVRETQSNMAMRNGHREWNEFDE